jgi:predicted phosphodiesterase
VNRTIVVGDVHGCSGELEDLLRATKRKTSDALVFVGDLVAKGPDSLGVVLRARREGALAVRGNHDERCLTWWRAKRSGAELPLLKLPHREVVDALNDDSFAWLDALPFHLTLPEMGVIVVHAGLVPGVSLDRQLPDDMMNMRSLDSNGRPSRRIEDGEPWGSFWPGPEHVVYGHDAIRGLQKYPNATGIDTGCVYGRALTALIFPGRELVSVPARRAWRALQGA